MRTLIDGGVLENGRVTGEYFFEKLGGFKSSRPDIVKEIRGKGLMIGMELTIAGKDIVQGCLDKGLIINCTVDRVLRFLPPLTATKADVDECMSVLEAVFSEMRAT